MCPRCGRPCPFCDPAQPEPAPPPPDDSAWIRRRERFYARVLGPPREPAVYHWDDGGDPHVDVYVHRSRTGRPGETILTGGLADRPMPGLAPDGDAPRRVELLTRMRRAEDWVPPLLREIASLPFRYGVPLRSGGLIQGSREIRPGSELRHVLLHSVTAAEGLGGFVVGGELVEFLATIFLTQAEFAMALECGPGAVLARLGSPGDLPRLDPARRSVC